MSDTSKVHRGCNAAEATVSLARASMLEEMSTNSAAAKLPQHKTAVAISPEPVAQSRSVPSPGRLSSHASVKRCRKEKLFPVLCAPKCDE